MKRSFLAVVLLFSVVMLAVFMSERSPAEEQSKADRFAEVQQIANEAIEKLKQDDLEGMVDVLQPFAGNENFKDPRFGIPAMKATLATASELGKNLGECELIGRETVGSSYVRFVYLQKYEKSPIVWDLIFYKPQDKWLSRGFTYNQTPQIIFHSAQNLDHDMKVRR